MRKKNHSIITKLENPGFYLCYGIIMINIVIKTWNHDKHELKLRYLKT